MTPSCALLVQDYLVILVALGVVVMATLQAPSHASVGKDTGLDQEPTPPTTVNNGHPSTAYNLQITSQIKGNFSPAPAPTAPSLPQNLSQHDS